MTGRGPGSVGMRVAVIGGTGRLGGALARRLHGVGVDVLLGSRDVTKAQTAARSSGLSPEAGRHNREAAGAAGVIVVTVPYAAHREILLDIAAAAAGKIVVETTVPPAGSGPAGRPPAGSAAEDARTLLPGARIVAGFHTVSAPMLADLTRPPHGDVLLCGDDAGAKDTAAALVRAIGMRAVDAGPLAHARVLEPLAWVLMMINKRYKRRDLGIQIAGLD